MNKQLKLLQRSKVLKTLEVEKVKHDLSKIKNSTIVMVAYDDATDKFLIGDNSGDLYVATSEYLKSLDIKNSSIDSIINGLTKSSIAQHFNKISLQEAKEMFGKKYLYYWSANNKIYGVKEGLIERLDNGPDNTNVVELWDRTENVLSNDRGVTGLKEMKFSAELRPGFLTFDNESVPTYTRDQNLIVRDPVKIADNMNKDIQNHDYVPKNNKYGYDMKDSNAVMKAYLGTDDLVVLSNIDKREVIDIDPSNVDPDNPYITYVNNTPFNHNYNMIWSTIRSGRSFEEFNDESEDNNSQFVNMTRHYQNELPIKRVDAAGLYANVPNLFETYTDYIYGKELGNKQFYTKGTIGISIKNEIKWSLDKIDGNICTITKRVYNSITGEIPNAQKTYQGIVEFEIVDIKDNSVRIKKTFRIPILNNIICDNNKFEYKHDADGNAISLPTPAEYEDGIIEYKLDTTNFAQGTNGRISYGLREIFIQSGITKYFLNSTNGTGTALFTTYTLDPNAISATIRRDTEIVFKNTDGSNFSYKTTNNGIGTGSVEYLVADAPTGVVDKNHVSRHTRNVHYMSGSTDVICGTDFSDPIVNYEIYTLDAGKTTATLKGSSTGVFNSIVNGKETETSYNIVRTRHITVTSNTISYTRNPEVYTSENGKCSQTMNVDYSYGGLTIRKTITKEAPIVHSVFTLEANASSAIIKRDFRPVFYTVSAGLESSSIIYKNDVVEIDRNQTASVSHTVSNSVTSASGSEHYATHTRTVTYKPASVQYSYPVLIDNVSAAILYTWKDITNESKQFYGSSTATFKTYSAGVPSTAYDKTQSNHLIVNCTVNETDSVVSNTACLQLIGSYTYGSVTKKLIKNSQYNNVSFTINRVDEHSNSAQFSGSYYSSINCMSNGVETNTIYKSGTRVIPTTTGPMSQSLTYINHANSYNFNTIIKDNNGNVIVNTNSMNVRDRLGGVSLQQAASMLYNNTNNAKNKVYVGDYIEFTTGYDKAKYVLVERTAGGNLIFMSSERHKYSDVKRVGGWPWNNFTFEYNVLDNFRSNLGLTPRYYTRKSDRGHLNGYVFAATVYELFGTYFDGSGEYVESRDRYPGERQWEAFNFNKEGNRKLFRRDVKSGNIGVVAGTNSREGDGYWLANIAYDKTTIGYINGEIVDVHTVRYVKVYRTDSGSCGEITTDTNDPDYGEIYWDSDNGESDTRDWMTGIRPCFML